jgi:glutathione peroxidase-family protein
MLVAISLQAPTSSGARGKSISVNDESEFAPIVERNFDFYDFTLKTREGRQFNLRDYASDKKIVIVGYVAGWCKNSNDNGHVVKRLYDKYKERGLGVVLVTEYSNPEEVQTHINRIGVDYPVVTETDNKDARKKSQHYKYRQKVKDARKWGTPFYVIVTGPDIEPVKSGKTLARRIFTVSGEIIESEAEQFIERQLATGDGKNK